MKLEIVDVNDSIRVDVFVVVLVLVDVFVVVAVLVDVFVVVLVLVDVNDLVPSTSRPIGTKMFFKFVRCVRSSDASDPSDCPMFLILRCV